MSDSSFLPRCTATCNIPISIDASLLPFRFRVHLLPANAKLFNIPLVRGTVSLFTSPIFSERLVYIEYSYFSTVPLANKKEPIATFQPYGCSLDSVIEGKWESYSKRGYFFFSGSMFNPRCSLLRFSFTPLHELLCFGNEILYRCKNCVVRSLSSPVDRHHRLLQCRQSSIQPLALTDVYLLMKECSKLWCTV